MSFFSPCVTAGPDQFAYHPSVLQPPLIKEQGCYETVSSAKETVPSPKETVSSPNEGEKMPDETSRKVKKPSSEQVFAFFISSTNINLVIPCVQWDGFQWRPGPRKMNYEELLEILSPGDRLTVKKTR
jgi:hypothetical protein